jgi:hypothetical protein
MAAVSLSRICVLAGVGLMMPRGSPGFESSQAIFHGRP